MLIQQGSEWLAAQDKGWTTYTVEVYCDTIAEMVIDTIWTTQAETRQRIRFLVEHGVSMFDIHVDRCHRMAGDNFTDRLFA